MFSDIRSLLPEFVRDALNIVFIFLLGKIVMRIVYAAVLASMTSARRSAGYAERVRNIENVIYAIGNTVLYAVILFFGLSAVGVDIGPILAGAGAIGLIAGLGAQTLLKDFISGIVITAEDQYRVGERVKINAAIEGTVTRIALRLTTLRGDQGEVHHILNNSITMVTNFSRK